MPHCSMIGQSPPQITYLGQGAGPFAIGPARSDRVIVTFFLSESDAANTLSSVTIGGVSATIDYAPTSSDPFGVAHAVVPTGTTASISSSGAGAQASYMITGLANNAIFSQQGSGASQSISTPDGFSAVVGGARGRFAGAPYGITGSNTASAMAVDATQNNGGGSNPAWVVGSCIASGAGAVTINQTGSISSALGYSACYY